VTLHGGQIGWDRRNWTLYSSTKTSITFRHIDAAHEGFPGTVTAYATHTVSDGGVFRTVVNATATQLTPIMLTQHNYWSVTPELCDCNDLITKCRNLDSTDTILNHTLFIRGGRTVDLDGIGIPTGKFTPVAGTAWDFTTPRQIGSKWSATTGTCGSSQCVGYDREWILNPSDDPNAPAVSLSSAESGIKYDVIYHRKLASNLVLRLDITTNQPGVQVYTSYWLNTPRKATHGGSSKRYGRYGAVAIEQQGYVDAIHNPDWAVDQICALFSTPNRVVPLTITTLLLDGPDRSFEWSSTYKFSIVKS
jgi:aldose 1-epimerase